MGGFNPFSGGDFAPLTGDFQTDYTNYTKTGRNLRKKEKEAEKFRAQAALTLAQQQGEMANARLKAEMGARGISDSTIASQLQARQTAVNEIRTGEAQRGLDILHQKRRAERRLNWLPMLGKGLQGASQAEMAGGGA